MRILFIEPFLFQFARGIERFTLELSNHLAQRDVEVSILTWRRKKKLRLVEMNPRVKIYEIPTWRYYSAQTVIPFYTFHLLKHNYDIVNLFFAGFGEAEALYITKLFRKKLKLNSTIHYPLQFTLHRYAEFRKLKLDQLIDQFIAVSHYIQRGIREYFDRDSIVISSGVDSEQFKRIPDVQRSSGGPTLITTAALNERKGIQNVIRALPKVQKDFPGIKYFVLGKGEYKGHLVQLVKTLDLERTVSFLEPTSDVSGWLNRADIFLLLSHGEASPLAVLEAMACELPVVVSKQPPFDEMISESCGIMVDENDSEQVSKAILSLLRNGSLRRTIGIKAREHVMNHFSWNRVADQYVQLFQNQLR